MEFENYFAKKFEDFKEVIFNTTIEIKVAAIALAIAGMVGLGYVGHKLEFNKEKMIPLNFSEISQIKDNAKKNNKEVDTFTLYNAGLNDLSMKVFEAWNDSWRYSTTDKKAYMNFADNLFDVMTKHKFRHNLADFLKSVPEEGNNSLNKLSGFIDARNRMNTVKNHFSNTWDESHIDNYHTEMRSRTVTHTDSEGHTSTSTEYYTVSVYDDTTHTYNYNRNEGLQASVTLDNLLEDFKDIPMKIEIETADKVKSENRSAIKESRKNKSKKEEEQKDFSETEYLNFANQWKFGSIIYLNKDTFEAPWNLLKIDADKWRGAKETARSDRYKTTRHSDSGSLEYQIANKTKGNCDRFIVPVNNVVNGINYIRNNMPELEKKIKLFMEYGHADEKTSKAELKKMAFEIKEMTQEIYKEAFPLGADVKRYNVGMVILCGLIGLFGGGASGAGVGFIIDRAGNYFYNRKKEE